MACGAAMVLHKAAHCAGISRVFARRAPLRAPSWPAMLGNGRGERDALAEIEFRSQEDVEHWLKDRRRADALVLAARAALRVAPLLRLPGKFNNLDINSWKAQILLPFWGSVSWTWFAARYPERDYAISHFSSLGAGSFSFEAYSKITATYDISEPGGYIAACVLGARPNIYNVGINVTNLTSAVSTYTKKVISQNSVSGTDAPFGGHSADQYDVVINAEQDILNAITLDARALAWEDGAGMHTSTTLASAPLWSRAEWPEGAPDWARRAVLEFQNYLIGLQNNDPNEHWDVWQQWYSARLNGGNAFGLTDAAAEQVETGILLLRNEVWKQGPKVVNPAIKRLIEKARAGEVGISVSVPDLPPEPSDEPGPYFTIENEKLILAVSREEGAPFEAQVQAKLHGRLKTRITDLKARTDRVSNHYPVLAEVVADYTSAINSDLDTLDVVDLWMMGAALMAQADAFGSQNAARTMTEPLEPEHLATLREVARLHGGFILGFPQGLRLTEDSDRARLSAELIEQIRRPTESLLHAFSEARAIMESKTRAKIGAIRDTLAVASWDVARIGHVCYRMARAGILALGRVLLLINDKGGSIGGGLIINALITASGISIEMASAYIAFVQHNSADILSFAAPFPELRAWIGWIIDHLDREQVPHRQP
jgi:hypothetical protein